MSGQFNKIWHWDAIVTLQTCCCCTAARGFAVCCWKISLVSKSHLRCAWGELGLGVAVLPATPLHASKSKFSHHRALQQQPTCWYFSSSINQSKKRCQRWSRSLFFTTNSKAKFMYMYHLLTLVRKKNNNMKILLVRRAALVQKAKCSLKAGDKKHSQRWARVSASHQIYAFCEMEALRENREFERQRVGGGWAEAGSLGTLKSNPSQWDKLFH